MIKRLLICIVALAGLVAAAELPSAEAIFEKSIQATGGKALYEKTKAVLDRGTIEVVGQGIKGTIVIVMAKPDKTDTVMDLPGLGQMRMGTGNGMAWQTSAFQGPRVLEGEERDQMIRNSSMDSLVNWRATYGDVKVAGEEMVDGKACWKLVAMPPKATKAETLWFEKESGLMVKSSTITMTPMGEVPTESRFSDFREVGGMKMPYVLRQSVGPQEIVTTIQEVTLNPELAAGQFDVPADIQALLNKK